VLDRLDLLAQDELDLRVERGERLIEQEHLRFDRERVGQGDALLLVAGELVRVPVATPLEIYNFPATAFVASFVGTLNLVAAGVVDAGAGRLSLDGQEVRTAKAVTGAGSDGRVTLAVRPEGISLGDGPEGANRLRGRIEDINFLGSIVRLRLGLGSSGNGTGPGAATGQPGGGTTIALDTFNEPHLRLPAVGDTVTVWFPHEACFVLGSAREGAAAVAEVNAEV
jgi:putative spermidine/putrescine transport system ATP-binding protein